MHQAITSRSGCRQGWWDGAIGRTLDHQEPSAVEQWTIVWCWLLEECWTVQRALGSCLALCTTAERPLCALTRSNERLCALQTRQEAAQHEGSEAEWVPQHSGLQG
ncbi:uncharacterized protein ACIBXB_004560 [Morphnus guianensis]